jgi:hypothetical protein
MLYSDINEAWNNPLGSQIKEFVKQRNVDIALGGNTPADNSKVMEQNDNMSYNEVHNSIVRKGNNRIIPPWGNKSEPIEKYLTKRHVNYDTDDEEVENTIDIPTTITKKKKKKSCDKLLSHIINCKSCKKKYSEKISEDENNDIILNENDFVRNDTVSLWGNKKETRQILLLMLSGIGVILLLDYLFR